MTDTAKHPTKFVIKRLPQTDEELWWTVQALWGYKIPRTPVCPGHTSPFHAFADAYFARSPVTVWKASRGFGGKSRTLGVLGLTEMALLGAEVSVLGGSGAQSLNVHATSQDAWAWRNAPKALLKQEPTKFDTVLHNGGHMRSLMASQTSVRGPHPARLRLDEIDEMELDILFAAQGQPMRQNGPHGVIETQTVMSSTHQYPDKTMTEMLKTAAEKGWPIMEWCWRETSNPVDGWLTPDEVERKRSEVPTHMWNSEYDLQEPSVEGRAIDTDAVERCFDATYGTFKGDRPVRATMPKLPDDAPPRHFITAADWAKKQDMTVVATFDTTDHPWVCVAWQRMNRQAWPYMVDQALKQWQQYGGLFVHDATGVGDVVDDIIFEAIPRNSSNRVKPIIMSGGRDRSNLFSEYVSAIEHDDIRYPRIEFAYGEHKYAVIDDLFGRGHPPDSVVAGALAWGQRRGRLVIGAPVGATKAAGWAI